MMASNLAAAKFLSENRMVTLKQCFDALRHNKESEKHILMTTALVEETLPAIAALNADLDMKTNRATQQCRNRVKNTIQQMVYR